MALSASSPALPPSIEPLDPAVKRLAAIVVFGAVTAMLDMTMVSVALAGLAQSFAASVATVQWVTTGYLLAITTVIPLTGWATGRFRTKTMWIFALTVFLTGSMLCGAAWSISSLIAFRVLQGLGGGMIVPLTMTILAHAAGPHHRGRVLTIVALPTQLAPITGPLLGGLIINSLTWRWMFYLNVPIGAIALLLASRGMPNHPTPHRQPLDLLGLMLLSPALVTLIYGLYRSGTTGNLRTPAVLVPLTVGLALLAAYAGHALRARTTPILDLRLFTHRSFAAAATLNFLTRISIFGAILLIPLYYQQARGHTALAAGLLLAPQSLATMLALPAAGQLTDRLGARPIAITGIALSMFGTLIYTRLGANTSELLITAGLLTWGLGIAATTVPTTTAAYHDLPPTTIPQASAALTTIHTISASFGATALVTVLQHHLTSHIHPNIPVEHTTMASAFGATFWWSLPFTALALIPALLLPHTPRHHQAAEDVSPRTQLTHQLLPRLRRPLHHRARPVHITGPGSQPNNAAAHSPATGTPTVDVSPPAIPPPRNPPATITSWDTRKGNTRPR